MSEWISVEESPKPIIGRYLVYNLLPSHMHNMMSFNYPRCCCAPNIAYYTWQGWQWSSVDKNECIVTHYMHLPEKPKEKE